MIERVIGTAAVDGLDLRYDQAIGANTLEAHRLIWLAQREGQGPEMADRLFRAHFTDGLDVGDPAVLAKLAGEVGVQDTGEGGEEVRAEVGRARELGITGVPLFLFEDKYAVSGAQPVETLVAALREVEQREPLSAPQGDACADGYCLVRCKPAQLVELSRKISFRSDIPSRRDQCSAQNGPPVSAPPSVPNRPWPMAGGPLSQAFTARAGRL